MKRNSDDLQTVRFLKPDRSPNGVYNPGDIAGFEPDVARKLVAKGYAELYTPTKGERLNVPVHIREPWEREDSESWLRRKSRVEEVLAAQKRG